MADVGVVGRKLSKDTQTKLIKLVQSIQERQRKNTEFIDKLEEIDLSYAKQKIPLEDPVIDCINTIAEDVIKVPIVASEVDTVASELINTFVNQVPLFGVLSDRGKPDIAMKFQALIERDARYQRWGRQLMLFLTKAARYNVAGIEVEAIWQKDVNVISNTETVEPNFEALLKPVTSLKALDMYNAIFDSRVPPADLAIDGEYVGYNEIYTRTRLKMLGNMLTDKESVYNATEAYESVLSNMSDYWNIKPDISNLRPLDINDTDNWLNWAGIIDEQDKLKMMSDAYLITKLYVRIIPSEFGISNSNRPIIVKIRVVNNKHLFSYKEVITPLDMLPILFCDLREDGFGYQTHSVGENVKPYQDIATTLLDIRLSGSKRALDDRAIYDSYYLDEHQVNQRIPTAKIPLKATIRNSGDRPPLNTLYYPIPFDASGTIAAMQDMSTILAIKDDVNGTNFTRRGEQRPGNRTLGEFDQLSRAGSGRTVPYNIAIEEQIITPMKMMIKINTLSSTESIQKVFDRNNEQVLEVNLAELRQEMLEYKITGGLKTKQVLRDPNLLATALQAVQNSQELNQQYNTANILADLLSTAADIDISRHKREVPLNGTQPGDVTAGVPATDTNT